MFNKLENFSISHSKMEKYLSLLNICLRGANVSQTETLFHFSLKNGKVFQFVKHLPPRVKCLTR